jgi:hypothetical protein
MLNDFNEMLDVGRENGALGHSRENAQEIGTLKLAERVGVSDRDFAKANEINDFAINSRTGNALASSDLRRRFRPFAGVCRFFYLNGTRNGTRRSVLPRFLRRASTRSARW